MRKSHAIAFACAATVVSAAASPLRAQSCDAPPLFDSGGPVCSAARQGMECTCSECLLWDGSKGATWYQVQRCDHLGHNCVIVGDTRPRNRPAYIDDDGHSHPAFSSTLWCVGWDDPFPPAGASFDYSVRSCTDGASGPLCAAGLSNAVNYVAAPYMCIDKGLEVACAAAPHSSGAAATDLDGDGITDAIDADDDGDGIPDAIDNCPRTYNPGQRDADGDHIGDACDPDPLNRTPGAADADGDGIPDRSDDCPAVYDPQQLDSDHDRTGNACDNCPNVFNETQTDSDGNGVGDACDLDDGAIYVSWSTRSTLTWGLETGFSTWCVYRGDLAELRHSGTYTQAPGSNPLAARFCALTAATKGDSVTPAAGGTAFYLVGGRPGPSSSELGIDSAGLPRSNANACP
jgi:Thrombospondin type 3 repeat